MRVFARETLREFWTNHSDSEEALKAWFSEMENSKREFPADIKEKYPYASILPDKQNSFQYKGQYLSVSGQN